MAEEQDARIFFDESHLRKFMTEIKESLCDRRENWIGANAAAANQ